MTNLPIHYKFDLLECLAHKFYVDDNDDNYKSRRRRFRFKNIPKDNQIIFPHNDYYYLIK